MAAAPGEVRTHHRTQRRAPATATPASATPLIVTSSRTAAVVPEMRINFDHRRPSLTTATRSRSV